MTTDDDDPLPVRSGAAANTLPDRAMSYHGPTHLARTGHERETMKGGNCRICHRAVCARYKERNPEKATASSRRWRKANPEKMQECRENWLLVNRDKYKATVRATRLADPARFREYGARYRAKYPERQKARHHAYWKANPEKYRLWRRERRARECGSGGTHTMADVEAQFRAQRGRCFWCNKKLGKDYEVDHVIPVSRGGSNGRENIVCACRRCNRRKHNKLPAEFAGRFL